MLTRLSFLLIVLQLSGAQAAGSAEERKLEPFCGGLFNLCGYHDAKTHVTVMGRRFERAGAFHENIAAVRVAGRWGYVGPDGFMDIEPRFDDAGSFYQGLAEVVLDGKAGVIDRQGRIVVRARFARAIPFTKDVLIVVEHDDGSGPSPPRRNVRGLDDDEFLRDEPLFFDGGSFGLYHLRKGWIVRPHWRGAKIFEQQGRGLIWASANAIGGPWGLLRADGTWQVEPVYHEVKPLREGLAPVSVEQPSTVAEQPWNRNFLWGAVDESGKLVVAARFDDLSDWEQGYGIAEKDGRYALVAPDGSMLGGRWFDRVQRPRDGRMARALDEGKWFSLTSTGSLVPDELEGRSVVRCPQGLTIRKAGAQYRLFDGKGREIGRGPFDGLGFLGYSGEPHTYVDCNKPVVVQRADRWSSVTPDGRLLFDPPSLDYHMQFRSGFAPVERNGKWGFIDETGAFVVEPVFDSLANYRNWEILRVSKDGREFLVNVRGEEVPGPDAGAGRSERLQCAGGGRLFKAKGLWGIRGPGGRVIIAPKHRAITCFSHGVAMVPVDSKRGWCALGPDGKLRVRTSCGETWYPVWVSHSSPETFAPDPYENSVLWVRAWLDYGLGERGTEPQFVPDKVGTRF